MEIFSLENLQSQDNTINHPLLLELNSQSARVQALLSLATTQEQRQWNKRLARIATLLEEFIVEGDLSDKNFLELNNLIQKLTAFIQRLEDLELISLLAPSNFLRTLLARETLIAGMEYHADLPGFGEVTLIFNKEVSETINKSPIYFDNFLPFIFNGLVAKKGQSGLKRLSNESTHFYDPESQIEYQLYELKNTTINQRILAVHASSGHLYFIRYLQNHKRIDYVSKGRFLQTFLQNLRANPL